MVYIAVRGEQPSFRGTPGAKIIQEGNSSREFVEEYTASVDLPGAIVIPSRLSPYDGGDDTSGLQANGYDPHAPLPQLVDPSDSDLDSAGNLDKSISARKEAQMVKVAVTEPPKSPGIPDTGAAASGGAEEPRVTVTMHLPGMNIPCVYHKVIVQPESHMVVLVTDKRYAGNLPPEFQVTPDGEFIYISVEGVGGVMQCQYLGQRFTLEDALDITLLILHDMIKEGDKV